MQTAIQSTAYQETIQEPTRQEQNIAILAHASIIITFLVGVTTGGIGTLAGVLVPLFIWLIYRDRSPFVAYHAMQATLFQLVSVFLLLVGSALIGIILAVIWIVTILLSFVLIGILLIPVAIILSIAGGIILIALSLGSLAYGLTAAWNVYNRGDFRYQWIAGWLDKRPLSS